MNSESKIIQFKDLQNTSKPKKRIYHKRDDHTHRYDFCVYEYDFPSREHPGTFNRECSIGTYCPVCGKVGARFTRDPRYIQRSEHFKNRIYLGCKWNDEALKELDSRTRTLPTFFLEHWSDTKYVDLKGGRK